ncbi:hypothetical protein [Paenibacillus fonticola]|uniref:hypothetical protein n=1 Tax=Paenibacillus fonticola TaxID=379896 RepID=UPI0003796917|nr:hypothetical protein [Paenibacillus fonticola]
MRVIIVPFTVGKDGIEIASIADAQPIHNSEEHYALIFSALPATINLFETYEFTFVKSEKVEASILKADDQLSPPEKLMMEAYPAV